VAGVQRAQRLGGVVEGQGVAAQGVPDQAADARVGRAAGAVEVTQAKAQIPFHGGELEGLGGQVQECGGGGVGGGASGRGGDVVSGVRQAAYEVFTEGGVGAEHLDGVRAAGSRGVR